MKESIGNSFVFSLVLVFVVATFFILLGSMSYSKASKVKNKIVSIIDLYANSHNYFLESDVVSEIDRELYKIGYKLDETNKLLSRDKIGNSCQEIGFEKEYKYAIQECCSETGVYFIATAYMFFDLPLGLGSFELPVSGETTIYQNYYGTGYCK